MEGERETEPEGPGGRLPWEGDSLRPLCAPSGSEAGDIEEPDVTEDKEEADPMSQGGRRRSPACGF